MLYKPGPLLASGEPCVLPPRDSTVCFSFHHWSNSMFALCPVQGATSPAVKHEFNKLGFNDLGFNDLISTTLTFNNPHFQQPLDSTTLRFNKKMFNNTHLQRSFDSTTLGFNDPWIQQTWIQQPLGSTTLNSTILGFNKLGFNDPWIQQSCIQRPSPSTILGFNNP